MSASWSLMLTNPDKKKGPTRMSQVEACESPRDNGPMNRISCCSPTLVAEKILEVAASSSWQLRHLVGPDAGPFL
jgi:hypothetical protein